MTRKAFILVPFLSMFALILSALGSIAVNEFRTHQERINATKIDVFSLIEIESFKRIKNQFETFKPKDFSYTAGEWSIKVTFLDESATIIYKGSEVIQARLDYDMVFGNILNYQIINPSQSDID
jgi:1-deoxy-D-xylulose 5-phosphate reductoisomerase